MNSGAEAVETAIKAARKWGYEVKGVPEGQAEIIVCADNFHGRTLGVVGFSTDPDARGGFGPFVPGFSVVPFGDADALEAAITPEHRRLPGRADPGRGRRHHPAGRLLRRASRELCTRARRHPDPRRDPDRPRPHRQAAGRGARGHRGRRDADRQGARRRLLPGLGGALEHRGAGRAEARPARLDLRRQPARLRRRPRGAEGAGRGGPGRALGRARRLLQGRPRGDPLEPRARGPRPRPDARRRAPRATPARPGRWSRRCASAASSPRRPTARPSASPRRSSSSAREIDWALERIAAVLH